MRRETQKHQDRRRELLDAVQIFTKKYGWNNFTVRDICEHLGISTGTFYHYFQGKDQLFVALFSGIDETLLDCEEHFSEDEIENIIQFCCGYARHCVESGVEVCRELYSITVLNSDLAYNSEQRPIYTILYHTIRRGQEKEVLNPTLDAMWLTRTLILILRGYSADWARHNGRFDLVDNVKQFVTLFLTSVQP